MRSLRDFLYSLNIYMTRFKLYRILRYFTRTVLEHILLSLVVLKQYIGIENDLAQSLKTLKKSDTLIIVGNGPSLNKMDLSFLKNFDTFTANAFHLKANQLGFSPTYHIVEDNLPAYENREALSQFKTGMLFVPHDLAWMYRNTISSVCKFLFMRSAITYRLKRKFDFSLRPDLKVYWGGTVLFAALQFALFAGYRKVILIGVDLKYVVPADAIVKGNIVQTVGADPNHFDATYFGYGKKWHLPEVDRMQRAFDKALEVYQENNIDLLNAGVESNLKNIPKIDHAKLLNECDQ